MIFSSKKSPVFKRDESLTADKYLTSASVGFTYFVLGFRYCKGERERRGHGVRVPASERGVYSRAAARRRAIRKVRLFLHLIVLQWSFTLPFLKFRRSFVEETFNALCPDKKEATVRTYLLITFIALWKFYQQSSAKQQALVCMIPHLNAGTRSRNLGFYHISRSSVVETDDVQAQFCTNSKSSSIDSDNAT